MYRKQTVAILLPTLTRGDATAADVLGMREALTSAGYDVRLFAEAADPKFGAESNSHALSFLSRHKGLVIYHHGIYWETGAQLLDSVRGPLIIRDHNVTPSRFFEGVSAEFSTNTRLGIVQRQKLARRKDVTRYLPCSNFSATELISFGTNPKQISPLPPLHNIDHLINTAADPRALRQWAQDPADILFVGRIAPNKGHRRLVRVAAVYRELFGQPLRVRFVGTLSDQLVNWELLLRQEANQSGLCSQIDITGAVSEAELKAAYLTSRIFVSCSEHEGFSVPLVEASAMGLPVLISDQPAMVETMGDVGITFAKTQDDEMATMVHRLLHSSADRENVRIAQHSSLQKRFSRTALMDRFLQIVREVVS